MVARAGRDVLAVAAVASLFSVPGAATAQTGEVRTVSGTVLRPGAEVLEPMRGLWVTLHRIGPDHAGPLDSVRTDARGAYSFRYLASGDDRAIYFAAASFGGIAYFTPPLVAPRVAGETAEIVVFDTTSAAVPITVRGRHLVVASVEGGGDSRSVIEVYELSNDTTVARVSPTAASPPTWTGELPAGARDPHVTDGDIPAEAVSFSGGVVRVIAPMPPGVKQIVYSYTLPAAAFPLSVPLSAPTDVYEVLIEDPAGIVRGAQLQEVESVVVDGRHFRRFLAQDVAAGSVSVVDIPRVSAGLDARYMVGLTLLLGGTMLFTLARVLRAR